MAKDWKDWQVPPQAVGENYKLGWLNEHAEDGMAWNKSQRGWNDHHKAFEILAGKMDLSKIPAYRSSISTARLKRNIRQVRGAVTNIRPIWGYSSANEAFAKNALMMNETSAAIYQEQFLDLSLRSAFDWAAATCTGWIHPVFRKNFTGDRTGNLYMDTYGQPCILPTQIPSSGDIQRAYAVSLLDEVPVYMAHGIWPDFAKRLQPTSGKVWYSSEIRTAARGNLLQRMFGSWLKPSGGDNSMSDTYVPVRKTWVIDLAVNETGQTLYMGDWDLQGNKPVPLNSWSYAVPSYKSLMQDGKTANISDARLYPFRRLLISSETCIMYDGPAFDWHGELPLIPLCLDEWAFDPVGFSLVRDGYAIQESLNELERGTMDKNRAQMDMGLAYDINSVTTKEAMQYDPMQPRSRVGFDGSLVTQPFTSPIPTEVLKVAPEIFTAISHLQETMDYQMGVNDIAAMARARGLVNTEGALDKLLEASGPIVMDITRSIERTITKIGTQVKFIIPQYFTVRQIMTYVGANKISQQTYDFDPEKLIPSHMPHEEAFDKESKKPIPSKYSLQERALLFATNLRYTIAPHTAHEITQMAMKLGLIQLRKAGIQISSKTIAAAWNIQDFGGPDADTEYERYMKEQEDVAEHAIRLKNIVDSIVAGGVQPTPAINNSLATLAGGETQEGRPPVGSTAPPTCAKRWTNQNSRESNRIIIMNKTFMDTATAAKALGISKRHVLRFMNGIPIMKFRTSNGGYKVFLASNGFEILKSRIENRNTKTGPKAR